MLHEQSLNSKRHRCVQTKWLSTYMLCLVKTVCVWHRWSLLAITMRLIESNSLMISGRSWAHAHAPFLVQRAAWPRAFHAIAAVVVGRKHFEGLRTALMQALRLQKPGANPELQCCLEGDTFDPLVFAAVETLRDARTLQHAQLTSVGFSHALFGDSIPEFNTLNEILC